MKKSLLLLPALMLFLTGCVEDDASSEDPSVDEPSTDEPSVDEPSVDEPVYYDEPTGDENHDGSEWKAIYELTTELSEDGQYYLHRDTSLVSNIVINANVTICLNGHVLTGAGEEVTHLVLEDGEEAPEVSLAKSSVFTVNEGYSVTLHDCQDGLVENTIETTDLFENVEEVTFTSGVITGGCDEYGGAFYFEEGATFVMESGAIAGNHAYYGAALSMESGSFTLKGGSISYNHAYYAGGVYAIESDMVMDGGEVSYNTSYYAGGGIYMSNNYRNVNDPESTYVASNFEMNGGKLSNNSAGSLGGGLYMNTASYSSGYDQATITLNSGSVISDNYANTEGGGIFANYTLLDIYGGTYTGNQSNWGGFLKVEGTWSTTNIYDGYFAYNVVSNHISGYTAMGGAMYFHYGTVNMYGGTVEYNVGESPGGSTPAVSGIYAYYRVYFNMYGGTIANNSATNTTADFNANLGVGNQSVAYMYGGTVEDFYTTGTVTYLDDYFFIFYGGYLSNVNNSATAGYSAMKFVSGYLGLDAYDVAKDLLGSTSVAFNLSTSGGESFDSDYDENYPYGIYNSYYSIEENIVATYGESYDVEITNFTGDYDNLTFSWTETSGAGDNASQSGSGTKEQLPTAAGTYAVTVQGNALVGDGTLNDDKLYMNTSDSITFTLTINKATPTPATVPADLEVSIMSLKGEPGATAHLTDIDLSEYNDDYGSWSWQRSDASTVVLSVGTDSYNVQYTPNDTNNYNSYVIACYVTVSL